MMTLEKLRSLVAHRPFRVMRITLKSGETYEVRHPENILLTKIGCVIADETQPSVIVFDPDQVTSVAYVRNARAKK